MEYSKNGLALTESFEGCKLTAYQDVRGMWTIGYGHTGPEVCAGLVWTQAQAEAALLADVQNAVTHVNSLVRVALTQPEFDALVDFTFNAGGGAFANSTMLKLLNAGNYQGAAAQFDRWDMAGGQVVAGLLRRRQSETQEFQGV
jgi:lysozyme